ncbi:dna-directed dna polymerase [Moniliophthora roreri MCA 2997]|uniref:Dna-directed dna polymerase n=1 Tax=Moniliophthora roreri (strain MCA 2997) TaxID=1381753 RepID=V2XCI4_MONRO|nr:dna-directed dna polymerase [Moniliophthora roreri MCA 2997]
MSAATTTLPLFWHLSSASKNERIEASVKLISALEQFQSHHEVPSAGSDEDEDAANADTLDTMNAQDVSYSVRRLIRGLASPRESSRLGFAVALTELLSRLETVTCSQISNLIINITKAQGASTGQEERDVLFARLFGFTSIIQSGLLVRLTPLTASPSSATQASSLSSYEEVLTQLISLGEKKSWLRESAWWSVGLGIDALGSSEVPWKDEALRLSVQMLFKEKKVWTPEKVAMVLKLQRLAEKDVDWKSILSPTFKDTNVLSNSNLQTVALILKEATVEDHSGDQAKGTTGSWKPQLHFVWEVILDILLPTLDSEAQKKSNFSEFFRVVVDESLFSSSSSAERKFWGFKVFQSALVRVHEDLMPMLFTKNFMRTWINHLAKKDRYLHKIATQTAAEVQKLVKENPRLGFSLILQLTGIHGNQQFDKLTRTKTVESILATMDTSAIKQYIDHLLAQANDDQGSIETINARRRWIIDQLFALIRNGAIQKSDEWVQVVLDWFVVNGLFVVKKKKEKSKFVAMREVPKPTYSDDLRQHCRTRLLACLADLTNQANVLQDGDVKTKLFSVASDREFWASKVLATIEELQADKKHVTPVHDVDEETQTLYTKAKDMATKLRVTANDDKEAASGAELLLLASVIQNLCSEDSDDSIPLEDCLEASTRMFLEKPKKKKFRKSTVGEEENQQHEPIDIFVDAIIGCLERSTVFTRVVGNQVFSLMSGFVKESSIDLILTQLEKRDPNQENDSEVDEEEDVEDDDSERAAEDSVEDDDSSSSDENDSEDDADNNDEEPDEELRKQIMEVLAVNGIQAATSETDDEVSEEEYMDDDQMMAIDVHLAEIFKMRLNEKNKSKGTDAQREAIHFKNRVLDLVDIFVKKRPSSPHVVQFVVPLLDLATKSSPDEKQLSDKAQGLLRSRIGKLKDVPTSVDAEALSTALKNLHERARKLRSSDYLSTVADCAIYISHLMMHSGHQKEVLDTYRASLVDFFTRKNSSLNAAFFHQFIRRFQSEAWDLRDDLLDLSQKAINTYRRCQAFQLVHDILTQLPTGVWSSHQVSTFLTKLRKALIGFISEGGDGKTSLTASQMREIFKSAVLAHRQTRRLHAVDAEQIWDPSSWGALSERLAESGRYKGTLQMCKQLARTDGTDGAGSKRKLVGQDNGKIAKRKKVVQE